MPFQIGNIYGAVPKKKGNKNSRWKGITAGFRGKHCWLTRNYGKPIQCDNLKCKKKSQYYDWANISGKYKRNRNDYFHLCRSCHKCFDMGLIEVKNVKKPLRYRFSEKDIIKIKKEFGLKLKSRKQIAEEYNVEPTIISKITHMKYYVCGGK